MDNPRQLNTFPEDFFHLNAESSGILWLVIENVDPRTTTYKCSTNDDSNPICVACDSIYGVHLPFIQLQSIQGIVFAVRL